MPKTVATQQHINFAIENYLKFPASAIDKKFGTSKGVTARILAKNGLKAPKEVINHLRAENQRKFFTKEQDDFIKKNIEKSSIKTIAKILKICPIKIGKRCHELGFSELLEKKSNSTRFKKGHEPLNKGVAMSEEVKEKVKHTFFKTGHLPHNTKSDGEISFRKDNRDKIIPHYRVKLGVWIPLKNKVWEDHHGEIPKGHLIILKDGDNLNTAIENLECISKAENMKRNTIHSYPEDLKKDILKLRSLNRTLKKVKQNGKNNP